MPVNAPREYFLAEEKFQKAKSREERIIALEEMIRLMPRHHGSETMLAGLKSRLAKLRKESEKKSAGGRKSFSIAKEGDAQICLIGFTNSGKSFLLSKITDAKPAVADHPYTTTKPEIGMIDYRGIKIQTIEIPATFEIQHLSIARTADLIVLLARHELEEVQLKRILAENFIRTKLIIVDPFSEPADHIKDKIWHALGLLLVYTKKKIGGKIEPMSLPAGATVRDFAVRIHKDFVKNFRFARITRKGRIIQAGLDYKLKADDIVEVYTR